MGRSRGGWARSRVLVVGVAALVGVLLTGTASGARRDARPPVLTAGNPSGIVFARGAGSQSGTSSNLVYHGGAVMTTPASAIAIFWGSSWSSSSGDKVSGMDTFYSGVGGTKFLGTTAEYTDGTGTHVYNGLAYGGHEFDNASAPRRAPSTSTVLNAVATTLAANGKTPVANGYYPVYSDQPRGHANYCAWHSWGTINVTLVQFAFFFNLDGDPGCDPKDTYSDGHSQGLAALGNVSGHELSEIVTDRHGDAWYDAQGAENADKCAWTFGTNAIAFTNSFWKIQGNWSNAAANAGGTGSYNGTGCVDGN
jgi:hypothetical protein